MDDIVTNNKILPHDLLNLCKYASFATLHYVLNDILYEEEDRNVTIEDLQSTIRSFWFNYYWMERSYTRTFTEILFHQISFIVFRS